MKRQDGIGGQSISRKISASLLLLALLAAIVGGAGAFGLSRLGLAVDLTSRSAAAVADVGAAVDAVNRFIVTSDPDAAQKAGSLLDQVNDGHFHIGLALDTFALESILHEFHVAVVFDQASQALTLP